MIGNVLWRFDKILCANRPLGFNQLTDISQTWLDLGHKRVESTSDSDMLVTVRFMLVTLC